MPIWRDDGARQDLRNERHQPQWWDSPELPYTKIGTRLLAVTAITPARPEQVLCWSSYIAVARVQSTGDWRCSYEGDGCQRHTGTLTVQIREILGAGSPDPDWATAIELSPGQSTSLTVEIWSHDLWDYGRTIREPSDTDNLSEKDIQHLMLGKDFIFGIRIGTWDAKTPPFRATVRRAEKRPWVDRATSVLAGLPNSQCPRPSPQKSQ